MKPEFDLKRFNELSSAELYEILSLRSEVFIVEQNCPYQDVDGKDAYALHLTGRSGGSLVAYARIFGAGDYFDTPSIGRVLVHKDFRNREWGHDLMTKAVEAVHSVSGSADITISAQQYLRKFYEIHGFEAIGGVYLEDDIPHIRMVRRAAALQ